MSNISQKAKLGTEVSIDASTFTGSFQALSGTIPGDTVQLIIQNDTNVTVTWSDDGTTNGLSLIAGVRVILDMRANKGDADTFAFPANIQFYAKGAAGAGLFKIAPIRAV
jgi:hypothetical protein